LDQAASYVIKPENSSIWTKRLQKIVRFDQLVAQNLAALCLLPGNLPGRVIEINSLPLRRKLRGFASGREEMTEASHLFAGLAYAEPDRLIETNQDKIIDLKHLSRLRRTWNDPTLRQQWAITQAVRLLGAIERAAEASEFASVWITEGLDFVKISEILAVPDDHLMIGFLAVNSIEPESAEDLFRSKLIDFDGFMGNRPS
jgi:nitroreductase